MKIVTFGEIMLRLQPLGHKRFLQAEVLEAVFGGGEANVAVSLAQFFEDATFLTKLPENPIADKCINELRSFGVDTKYIVRGGERMGIYFCEKGYSQRGSNVVYDRAHSSITTIDISEINTESLFQDTKWFHFTGITPALSEKTAETLLALLKIVKNKGITVSCDLNYRKKLWSREAARKTMTELMKYVDVLISNEEDTKDIFGIEAADSNVNSGKLNADSYALIGKKLFEMFPNIKYIAYTLRESVSASRNGWSGILIDKNSTYLSKKYDIEIIDRVGGGDSFGAGLIYGLSNGYSPQKTIEFAVAASCLKQTIEGDFNLVTKSEVEKLAEGDGSGRIVR